MLRYVTDCKTSPLSVVVSAQLSVVGICKQTKEKLLVGLRVDSLQAAAERTLGSKLHLRQLLASLCGYRAPSATTMLYSSSLLLCILFPGLGESSACKETSNCSGSWRNNIETELCFVEDFLSNPLHKAVRQSKGDLPQDSSVACCSN